MEKLGADRPGRAPAWYQASLASLAPLAAFASPAVPVRQLVSPRARRPLAALALVACAFMFFTQPIRLTPRRTTWSLDDGVGNGDVPLVNFIVPFKAGAWGSTQWPATLQYFVDSVARQPHAVAVTILERDTCSDHLKKLIAGVPNMQLVCMTDSDFWAHHVQYMCDSWGGCDEQRWEQMHADLVATGDFITAHSMYLHMLGFVFKDHVHPRAKFWGWTDLDVAFGDFTQAFPYDIALDYDVLAPTEHPMREGPQLLYTRGHFTLVRNRASTEQAMRRYPAFASYDGFENQTLPWIDEDMVPDFIINEPGLDMLFFTGLHSKYIQSVSAAGTLDLPGELLNDAPHAAVSAEVHHALSQPLPGSRPPSLSTDGVEVAVTLHAGSREPRPEGMDLWFDIKFANWIFAPPPPPSGEWDSYVFKRAGQWTQRYEPSVYIDEGPLKGARSWLYIHWQNWKKRSNFVALRERPMPAVWILHIYRGILGLDNANEQAFWLPVVDEHCDLDGCVPASETVAEPNAAWKSRLRLDWAARDRWYEMRRQRQQLQKGS